jgi:methyl-accepting chemotaxis protein
MLDDVDDETVQRILETGASIDEIAEAMHLVENNVSGTELPTTARVEEVREILDEARRNIGNSTWTAW